MVINESSPCNMPEKTMLMDTPTETRDMQTSDSQGASFAAPSPFRLGVPVKLPAVEENDEWPSSSAATSTTISSVDFFEDRHNNVKKTPLSVNRLAKIDQEMAKRSPENSRPSRIVTIFKWIGTLVVAVAFLASLTVSKVSIMALSARLKSTNPDDLTFGIETSRCLCMIVLLLLIPNLFNFFRALWVAGFRKDFPWPKRSSMFLGLLATFLESAGLCLFVLKVLTAGSAAHILLFMSGIFVVPILNNFILCLLHRNDPMIKKWSVLFFIALLFELAGLTLTVSLWFLDEETDTSQDNFWHTPVAIACLSIAWSPWLQSRLIQTKEDDHNGDMEESGQSDTVSDLPSRTESQSSGCITTTLENNDRQNDVNVTFHIPEKLLNGKTGSWKMTIFMSGMKIIFIIIFSFILFYIDGLRYNSVDKAWSDFLDSWTWEMTGKSEEEVYFFIANAVSGLIGYLFALMACSACMQRAAFALPLFLSTPLAIILFELDASCKFLLKNDTGHCGNISHQHYMYFVPAVVCLLLAQIFSTGWLVFRDDGYALLAETKIFWLPTYNGVLLEQWLLLARRNKHTDEYHEDPRQKAKRTNVYICTTMYREADYEMRELLESISRVNEALSEGDRHFESHIFFDGGVKDMKPSEFVLQLVALLESTVGVKPIDCTKTITPYGMTLGWQLKAAGSSKGMIFKIHLKDNHKVKNKKRWSQIMYLSYVLDFLMGQSDNATYEDTFILTTDADVYFTPESVEALLDLMIRDKNTGAVCARTHPLGSGPLVWYQTFEYAIGHWFQKAAEHVIGSVLCAPGCFSVYRCKALRDILPIYATNVQHAFDFLTKDMGEDRWLCTLMVQSGWRIEYCAASENSTHCPEEFEEFYKQRRRWIASTIANLMLLVKDWRIIARLNHSLSIVFLFYQAALLFSTLIGPSTVIMVVGGGLSFAWGFSPVASVVIQYLLCAVFVNICLFTSQNVQITTAKIITFLYAVVMMAVVVGTAQQVVEDLNNIGGSGNKTITDPRGVSIDFPVSVTTLYLGFLIGVFFLTALVHPGEFVCLIHGVWYFLCLPSGYLVLNIYSICNITDRSWGTREEKEISSVKKEPWHTTLKSMMKNIFFCWDKDTVRQDLESKSTQANLTDVHQTEQVLSSVQDVSESLKAVIVEQREAQGETIETDIPTSKRYEFDDDTDDEIFETEQPISIEEWLPVEFRETYVPMFQKNGFENTLFISGMNEKELKDIGVKSKPVKKFFLEEIQQLPDFDIDVEVPNNAEEWLETIGLKKYKRTFRINRIRDTRDMEILKSFSRGDIENELGITKPGHVKRLMKAIRKLRNPTHKERQIMEMKKQLENASTHKLKTVNVEEYDFWERLKKECLLPSSKAYGLEDELKEKLGSLRNSWLMILAVSNTLWLILIVTLASKAELTVLGSNPLGLSFVFIFGFIFAIQFLCMFIHRMLTLVHYMARAPYKFGNPYNTNWAFKDKDISLKRFGDSEDLDAVLRVKMAERKSRARLYSRRRTNSRIFRGNNENTPLLTDRIGANQP